MTRQLSQRVPFYFCAFDVVWHRTSYNAAMAENEPVSARTPPKKQGRRKWFQYRLRSLFVLTLIVGTGMSWFAGKKKQCERQQAIVDVILKSGGEVSYDYQFDASGDHIPDAEPPGPLWMRRMFGDLCCAHLIFARAPGSVAAGLNEFTQLERLEFPGQSSGVSDADLEALAGLSHLRELIVPSRQISDAGVAHLSGLHSLRSLNLCFTKITDRGLRHLGSLDQLQRLDLQFTQVKSIRYIKGLTQLEDLRLAGTQVDDAEVEFLKRFVRLETLTLGGTRVTDIGLESLKGLAQLDDLELAHAMRITDAGLASLSELKKLRVLALNGTNVTDVGLKHLKGLTQLKELHLVGTKVTDMGVAELKLALPDCGIWQ